MLALVLVSGAAGGASPFGLTSGPTATIATAPGPEDAVFADMNGDKKADIVVGASNDGTTGKVQVFLGNGKGAFTQKPDVNAGAGGTTAFVHDVTGDGKPDVIGLNYGDFSGTFDSYVNDGTGALVQHGSEIAAGGQPNDVVFGDWNGDNKTDIAIVDEFPSLIRFFLGDGSGGFVESQHVQPDGSALSGATNAVVHDFNGDGKDDLAVNNSYGGANPSADIQIWLSNGDGTFTASPQTFSLANLGSFWLYLVDANGDGKLDLVASGSGFASLLGDGQGGFGTPIVSPGPQTFGVPVDINADKKVDFYSLDYGGNDDSVALFIGNGLGSFVESPVEYGVNAGDSPAAYWVDAADVNGDKKPDLAVTDSGANKVSILLWTSVVPSLPTITRATPTFGQVGDSIVLTGHNLQHVAGVSFGGPLGAIQAQPGDGLSLTVTVPTGANYGKLSLISEKGITNSSVVFAPVVQPVITAVSPIGGQKAGGIVTILGSHFSRVDDIALGGTILTNPIVADGKITAKIPLGTNGGAYTLTIGNQAGTAHTSYAVAVIPAIDSFLPPHGPANATQTTNVTIQDAAGTLLGTQSVLFHGKPGKNIAVATDGKSLTVDAPAGATTGTIMVNTPAGGATSASTFTVDPQPVITSLSAGAGGLDQAIQIHGRNLPVEAVVKFGDGTALTVDTSGAPTLITANVPATATAGKVTVTGNTGTATSSQVFTPQIAPDVTSFSPSIGALPGGAVTITGRRFKGTTHVAFNGAEATFKVVSDTSITTKVPLGATTGTLQVTNPFGAGSKSFYVISAPGLAATGAFSPTAAGSGFGTQVTITGTHLGGVTSVTFNGHAAVSFTVDTDTQITATPPTSAATGVISVTNAAGTAATTDSFTLVTITSLSGSSFTAGELFAVFGHGLSTITRIVMPGIGAVTPTATGEDNVQGTMPACGGNDTGVITIYIGPVGDNNTVHSASSVTVHDMPSCP